jgi:hypothetical protein
MGKERRAANPSVSAKAAESVNIPLQLFAARVIDVTNATRSRRNAAAEKLAFSC